MTGTVTIMLLIVSNVFMTCAWYGHLRFKGAPLWQVILLSWLIAFVEYCFQVPANRLGSYEFSAAQLKIMQEVITLVVFGFFSVLYLKQQIQWNHVAACILMIGAVMLVFMGAEAPFRPRTDVEGTQDDCRSSSGSISSMSEPDREQPGSPASLECL